MLNIVLVEPEIPQNTGNIARTCAAVHARLHLVKPLGFALEDSKLKRAGLDYWHLLDVKIYENLENFLTINRGGRMVFCTTKAPTVYSDYAYKDEDFLVFGKETRGLPEDLLKGRLDQCVRLPMVESARSLNLSNAVAVVAYEALRQTGFKGLLAKSGYFTDKVL